MIINGFLGGYMANLKYTTLQSIEDLFDMSSGYVIDFSNNSFQRFIKGIINIDIYQSKGYEEYSSKANKLRQIIEIESNSKVAVLIDALLNYYEDYKLKTGKLTDFEEKKITEIKKDIEVLDKEGNEKIDIVEDLNLLMQRISTRNAQFSEMALDEKIKEIANLMENLLKKNGKYISLQYEKISLGLIRENDVKDYRKMIQCYRHSSQDSLEERKGYSEEKKRFLVEYGVVACNLIFNEVSLENKENNGI